MKRDAVSETSGQALITLLSTKLTPVKCNIRIRIRPQVLVTRQNILKNDILLSYPIGGYYLLPGPHTLKEGYPASLETMKDELLR